MRPSKMAAGAALAYFGFVFLSDGTLGGLFDDFTRASKRVIKGSRRVVRKTI